MSAPQAATSFSSPLVPRLQLGWIGGDLDLSLAACGLPKAASAFSLHLQTRFASFGSVVLLAPWAVLVASLSAHSRALWFMYAVHVRMMKCSSAAPIKPYEVQDLATGSRNSPLGSCCCSCRPRPRRGHGARQSGWSDLPFLRTPFSSPRLRGTEGLGNCEALATGAPRRIEGRENRG